MPTYEWNATRITPAVPLICGLVASLNGYLGEKDANAGVWAHAVLGLSAVQTINFPEIALIACGEEAKVSSRYHRL